MIPITHSRLFQTYVSSYPEWACYRPKAGFSLAQTSHKSLTNRLSMRRRSPELNNFFLPPYSPVAVRLAIFFIALPSHARSAQGDNLGVACRLGKEPRLPRQKLGVFIGRSRSASVLRQGPINSWFGGLYFDGI